MQCTRDNTGMSSDPCAIEDRKRRNQQVADYFVMSPHPTVPGADQPPMCSMESRMEVGKRLALGNFNPSSDTNMFQQASELTRARGRAQVFPRWTNGVPNMDRGGLESDVESRVKLGAELTHVRPGCTGPSNQNLSEVTFDRFPPLAACMDGVVTPPPALFDTDLRVGMFTRNATTTNCMR